MTNKEAKEKLYMEWQKFLEDNIDYAGVSEAYKMAFKALEQEPTTKNDLTVDCISREQAKVAIRDKFKDIPSRVEINTILNELPSVTPQPCEDAVSRQEMLDLIADYDLSMGQVVRGIHALPSITPQEPCENNICDSCHTKGCIFQSGIKRVNCEFYTAQNEPCNDAISRESLLNKLCGYHVDIEKSIFDKLWRVIKDMPSVTPQEPTDKCKWIKYYHGTMCPKEHMDVDSPYWRIPENKMETLKYCPYCGKEIEVEK